MKLRLILVLMIFLSACTTPTPAALPAATPTIKPAAAPTAVVLPTQPETACTGIFEAVHQSDAAGLKACLLKGEDANTKDKDGLSLLNYAAYYGNMDVVTLLLDAGAEVNYQDPWGMSSLHASLKEGHNEVSRLLINRGADVNAKTTAGTYPGFAPLHVAAYFGKTDLDTIRLLLEKGADVTVKNAAGKTPLQIAEEKGLDEVAALLK